MCLSKVYETRGDTENLVCEYVSSASVREDGVLITDITGQEIVIAGSIQSIDLVNNAIYIGS